MHLRLPIALSFLLSSWAPAAAPLFLNILPSGQDGLVPAASTSAGPHASDQLGPYRDFVLAAPRVRASQLLDFFKDASIDRPAAPERTENPRSGCTIYRDAYDVPHVEGSTRGDVFFCAGYATAEDRLFLADALRHIGRGRFSEFVGGLLGIDATLSFDRTFYAVAGYSEAELQQQIDLVSSEYPDAAPQLLDDATQFTAGLNQYVAEARLDAGKRPKEYDLFSLPLEDWNVRDQVALATAFLTVIGFGNGGGGEHRNVILRQALEQRLGAGDGGKLWKDLREAEDPEAPVSTEKSFPYLTGGTVDAAAVAIPDAGSIVNVSTLATSPSIVSPSAPAAFRFPHGMSNWMGITRQKAGGGHPILVGGPQTGYFAPQALLELSLSGGGINARGATVPGTLYVVLGHTPHFAWTATAGGSDLADVRVERVCDPPGGDPASGTLFDGACRAMTRRVDTWMVGSTTVTATVLRTVHGPVIANATVDGVPVVLAVERASFGRELLAGPAFKTLNEDQAPTPEAFRSAMAAVTGTLNWLYVNDTDAAYFHTGRYPVRATGVDPDLPSWGTGEWEWQGVLAATQQPFEVNPRQGFATSWNNKPARGWRASDANYSYGLIYRSQLFDVRLQKLARRGRIGVVDAVNAMGDAATVDLRGAFLLPEALALLGDDASVRAPVRFLRRWLKRGAHRIDRDGDKKYDDDAAVALMDAWYGKLVHAVFDGQLADVYDMIPLRFDDAPTSHLGSAYQEGYYGYLKKVFRQTLRRRVKQPYQVLHCADGTRVGCAAALRSSLQAAVTQLTQTFGADPATWHVDLANDEIRFSVGGLAAQQPIAWQNRPTFQQVVQVR